MDTSHSDREGLDESTSSRGWGGLFQRKPRRDSRKEVEENVEEPISFETQMNDIGNPRRGVSKARVQRQQSNRNFLSAVCFPDEEEDLTKGLNERSFVKQLKELKEHDEKEAARRVSLKDSSRSLDALAEEANLALANDNMTAVQRTIARREAMKKRRAMQQASGASIYQRQPPDRGMAREGSSWY